jgi:hypothetical protein
MLWRVTLGNYPMNERTKLQRHQSPPPLLYLLPLYNRGSRRGNEREFRYTRHRGKSIMFRWVWTIAPFLYLCNELITFCITNTGPKTEKAMVNKKIWHSQWSTEQGRWDGGRLKPNKRFYKEKQPGTRKRIYPDHRSERASFNRQLTQKD